MTGILLSLGAPNDAAGKLSTIAMDRLRCVLQLHLFNPDFRILCTGGFGEHFNTAPRPHAFYSQQYLLQQGVPAACLLEGVPSTNTMEDFKLSAPVIEHYHPELLLVVTSDFHMKRARLLCNNYITGIPVVFVPALSTLPADELAKLQAHEEKALLRYSS